MFHQTQAAVEVIVVQITQLRILVVLHRRGHIPADLPHRLEVKLLGSLH